MLITGMAFPVYMRHLGSVVCGLAPEFKAFSETRQVEIALTKNSGVTVVFQTFHPLLTSASASCEILNRPKEGKT